MLYSYKCDSCGKQFEENKSIDERHHAICPECGKTAKKIITVSCEKAVWQPKWMYNVAPIPVYVESREQLTKVCNMMGNYNDRAFCRREVMEIKNPVKKEKREVIRKLRTGQY